MNRDIGWIYFRRGGRGDGGRDAEPSDEAASAHPCRAKVLLSCRSIIAQPSPRMANATPDQLRKEAARAARFTAKPPPAG